MAKKKLSPAKRGIKYEKRQATKTRSKHIGGPGKPDLTKGKKKIEVKNWGDPVHSGVIKKAIKNKVKTVIAKSGFTDPAKELAKKKGIKLRKGK
ncbi:MAG: hypothetical protein IIA45_14550 [Bacteroidetes bacterium]|nr:hypothetical protein [Bacteroidota bacterium]